MAGLLDDPGTMAQLQLAAGLLGGGNFGQALGRGLQGYNEVQQQQIARKMQDLQMQAVQIQLAQNRREAQKAAQIDALAPKFLRSEEQANALSMGPMPDGTSMPAVRSGFDVSGYANALAGIDPMKAIAIQQAIAKDSAVNKIDPKDYTPESVQRFAVTRNYGDLVQRVKKDFAPNGQVVDLYSAKEGASFADPNKPFAVGANGAIVPNMPYQQYELGRAKAGAPSMTAINNVAAFEPFANKLQGEMGQQLVKRFDSLQSAPQTLSALNQAKSLVGTSSPFVGSNADAKLAMVKFLNNNLGTNIAPDAVKDAETLRSTLFASVMENLRKMDASPSQQQQQVLQDAFGRLNTDPAALPQIIDFWKNQVKTAVAEHNRRVDATESGPASVKFPYPIKVDLPVEQDKPQSKSFKLDGGGSAIGTLGPDGNYYVTRNGKKYRVEGN